jgi:hypothetical protein
MASSTREAFSKLSEWQGSNAVLKLTLLAGGENPKTLIVQLTATDEEAFQVGFVERGKRSPRVLDVSEATFTVGDRLLEVRRSDTDVLMFELA